MSEKCIQRLTILLTAATLLLWSCSENPQNADRANNAPKLFITQSDFQSGQLAWISTDDHTAASSNLSIFSDASLVSFNGFLYVIEQYGADNIIKIDPSKDNENCVIYQKHLGDNWNPHDMVCISATKAYIANNNVPKITVFNPSSGTIESHIDISSYTFMPDSNTSPYANDLELVGGDLYVLLQRRNGFTPGAPSLLLKIDTATDTISDTIALGYKNGYAMAYDNGCLYVANPGSVYDIGDGGIEKVDLATKEVSTVIDENDLGGNPNQIVHREEDLFYIVNYISWKNAKVVEINMTSGHITTLPDILDAFGGIYYDAADKKLYVGERDSVESGIRVFEDNHQVGPTITSKNGLPPTDMTVVR